MNKLIFLGTGNANNLQRQMTSLLFITEHRNFLIDCGDGMGTVRQIMRANVNPLTINDIFITHRHADHITGITFLLQSRLIKNPKAKIRIFGPMAGLRIVRKITTLTSDLLREKQNQIAYIPLKNFESIKLHTRLQILPCKIPNPKGPNLKTYAYKITIHAKTIVFSADMHPNTQFTKLACNADMLVHECYCLHKDKPDGDNFGHSSAREAGECAQNAHAKQLILTHLPESGMVSTNDLIAEARQYFNGKTITAEDLMEIMI